MTIPRRFQLLGRDFKVVWQPEPDNDHDGWLDTDEDTIVIHAIGEHRMGHTFYHELVHALLNACGREDLGEDEQLVDVLGGLLYQFMRTAEHG